MDPPRAAAKMKATTATTVTLLLLLITFLIAVGRSAVEANAEERAENSALHLQAERAESSALHLQAAALFALSLDPTNMVTLAYLEQSLAYLELIDVHVPDVPGLPGYNVALARSNVALARSYVAQAHNAAQAQTQPPDYAAQAQTQPPDLHAEAPPGYAEAPPGYTAQAPGYTEAPPGYTAQAPGYTAQAQTQAQTPPGMHTEAQTPPGSMWIDRTQIAAESRNMESCYKSCWACYKSCYTCWACYKSCWACYKSCWDSCYNSCYTWWERGDTHMSQQLRHQIGNIWAAVGLSTVVFFIMALTLLVIRNLEKQKKSGRKTHAFPIDDVGSATN